MIHCYLEYCRNGYYIDVRRQQGTELIHILYSPFFSSDFAAKAWKNKHYPEASFYN